MNSENSISYSSALRFSELRTYLYASVFVVGNVVLPQLCHLAPGGGITWLPIYFFTLVGAYLFGWKVGLLTALASPLVNSALFGMPDVAVLPAIMMKSSLLVAAATVGARARVKATLPVLAGVVLVYQAAGTVGEWLMGASWHDAFQDFRTGLPGMLVQVVGGFLLIRYIRRRLK